MFNIEMKDEEDEIGIGIVRRMKFGRVKEGFIKG